MAIVAAVVTAPRTATATGVVVAVAARSLADVDGFTIRTADGQTIEFDLSGLQNGVEFPPGHLVEHITSGVPVIVTYRDEAGTRTAIRLADGPLPSPT